MDRYWFLTWTTYATWLPGDRRGFVGRVWSDDDGPRVKHNEPGTPYDADLPGLRASSHQQMRGHPIYLDAPQAAIVLEDLQISADYRKWELAAAAVMANHVHVVVGVPGDPDPSKLLQVFKSYASRRLNQQVGVPASKTWWTASGSQRKCSDEQALLARVCYVAKQPFKLALWIHENYREIVATRRAADESPP